MCETRFYICRRCGNIVGKIHDSGVPLLCCGEPMQELIAGSVDASREKHVPVVACADNTVTVTIGSTEHPMIEAHSILWVYLQTEAGGQRKCLKVGEAPVVTFALTNDKPVAAYAYCNLHGLWKTAL